MSGVAIAPTSVEGTNGSTIRSIAAVLLTETGPRQTGLAALRAETRSPIARQAQNNNSAGRAGLAITHARAGTAIEPAELVIAHAQAGTAIEQAELAIARVLAGIAIVAAAGIASAAAMSDEVLAEARAHSVRETLAEAALAPAAAGALQASEAREAVVVAFRVAVVVVVVEAAVAAADRR